MMGDDNYDVDGGGDSKIGMVASEKTGSPQIRKLSLHVTCGSSRSAPSVDCLLSSGWLGRSFVCQSLPISWDSIRLRKS